MIWTLAALAVAPPTCETAQSLGQDLQGMMKRADHAAATALAPQVMKEAKAHGCQSVQAQVHHVLGRLAPTTEAGLASLDTCIQMFGSIPDAEGEAACWIDRARLLGPGGDSTVAFAKAEALGADPFVLGWAQGEMQWAKGDPNGAIATFETALTHAPADEIRPYLYELAWRKQADSLASDEDRFQALATLDRVVARTTETPPLPSRTEFQTALEPEEGVLVFLLAPKRDGRTVPSGVGLITRTRIVFRQLKKAESLPALVAAFETAVHENSDWNTPGKALFAALLSELPDLPKQITVIPDGALATVPFSALIARDGRPLGVSTSLATMSTLGGWYAARTAESGAELVPTWEAEDVLGPAYREGLQDGASHGEAMQHAVHTAIDGGAPVHAWASQRLVGDPGFRPTPPPKGWGMRALLAGLIGVLVLGGFAWIGRKRGS